MNKNYYTLVIICFSDFTVHLNISHFGEVLAQDPLEVSGIEMLIKSKKEIAGHSKKSNIHFRAKDIDNNMIETSIIINNKNINVKVGYGDRVGEIYILGQDIDTGEIISITDYESEILNQDLKSMLKKKIGQNILEKKLIRTFNLLSSWPSSLDVILDPDKVTIPDECEITYPDGISENICPYVNELHIGRYATEGEFCGWAEYNGTPVLKLNRPTSWIENVEHQVGGDNCFGRCGKGCIGDGEPDNAVNIYTQDCFDHDLCAENEGILDAECNWMFIYAIDDFFYGQICSYISVSPANLDFGNVTVGHSSSPKELTTSNSGDTDLNILGITLSDTTNYSIDTGGGTNPCGSTTPTISANSSCTVTVTFTPSTTGTFDSTLTITSDDPESSSLDITLRGTGVIGGDNGNGDNGYFDSNCFIATATYGFSMADEVKILRKFRDNYLITNSIGRTFVSLYYITSPPIADYIKEHEALRTVTSVVLTPIVYSIKYPFILGFIMVIGGVAVIVIKRRVKK